MVRQRWVERFGIASGLWGARLFRSDWPEDFNYLVRSFAASAVAAILLPWAAAGDPDSH